MSLLDKIAAVLRRDFLTAIRYRAGLAALLLATAGELGAFFSSARASDISKRETRSRVVASARLEDSRFAPMLDAPTPVAEMIRLLRTQ